MVFHRGSDFCSLVADGADDWWRWASFHAFIGHLCLFFGEVLRCFAHFWIRLSFYRGVVSVLGVFWMQVPITSMICKCFLPFFGLSFDFLSGGLWSTTILILMTFSLSLLLAIVGAFGDLSDNSLPNPRSWRFTPTISLRFLWFQCLLLDLRFILSLYLSMTWGRLTLGFCVWASRPVLFPPVVGKTLASVKGYWHWGIEHVLHLLFICVSSVEAPVRFPPKLFSGVVIFLSFFLLRALFRIINATVFLENSLTTCQEFWEWSCLLTVISASQKQPFFPSVFLFLKPYSLRSVFLTIILKIVLIFCSTFVTFNLCSL